MQSSSPKPPSPDPMEELRDLLLARDREEVARLRGTLEDPAALAGEISRVLPDAILLRSRRDNRVAESLQPAIEDSIGLSVRKNPRVLADALFPLMGPAIRKAVSSALFGMIQSFNRILDHSFSIKGIRWRLEALRSGKSFAEVVMLHTLVYKVNQVFLIHRETALVLQHAISDNTVGQDPDLVSGMLSAIQDFVGDSFNVKEGEHLDALHFGDEQVLIEQGPHAVLATVIQGNPPAHLRETFGNVLERIHLTHGQALADFDGADDALSGAKEAVDECLLFQVKPETLKPSPLLWILFITLSLGGGALFLEMHQKAARWQNCLSELRSRDGIVITDYGKNRGKYYINGLLDSLGPDPAPIIAESGITPDNVSTRWEPYSSMLPKFILARAQRTLNPPDSVSISLSGGILTATGTASHDWITRATLVAPALQGVDALDADGVKNRNFDLFSSAVEALRKQQVQFPQGVDEIDETGQGENLREAVELTRIAADNARFLGKTLVITLTGHTTSTGSENLNLRLRHNRAVGVRDHFLETGFPPHMLRVTAPDSKAVRALKKPCVSFQVAVH